jgi:hypothetical protein
MFLQEVPKPQKLHLAEPKYSLALLARHPYSPGKRYRASLILLSEPQNSGRTQHRAQATEPLTRGGELEVFSAEEKVEERKSMGADSLPGIVVGLEVLATEKIEERRSMGANASQGIGILTFLLGFTALSVGLARGGVIYYLASLALLGLSTVTFLKCKPLENAEN